MLGNRPSHVRRLDASDADPEAPIDKLAYEIVLTSRLSVGDLVLSTAGEVVPISGVVVEGRAAVNDADAADWQRSPPVLILPGVLIQQGTHVVSGYVVVRVATNSVVSESA
jgi:high-affinity K+ transport system ATPase subunit B